MAKTLPIFQARGALLKWFLANARTLPWRKNRAPYRIWISEVMLQQTTVAAVIPYYERFLLAFPDLETLAQAPIEDVLKHWSGLGYYSRARNLHQAAQALLKTGFPKTYNELIKYKGFGPYTARAVSSLAFGESVGVLDGNVIRVLSRYHGLKVRWWTPQGRSELQKISDAWNLEGPSHLINQGLMELGATLCTPQSPACLLCPLLSSCVAQKEGTTQLLPLKKERRQKEIWIWQPKLIKQSSKIAFVKNDYAPFLKGQWILPGKAATVKKKPAEYLFKHMITHHEIYVLKSSANLKASSSDKKPQRKDPTPDTRWIEPKNVHHVNPTSFVEKTLRFLLSER